MTNLELFKIFRPLIMKVSRVPEVILSDQNAPAPAGTYCAMQMGSSLRQYGQVIERREVTKDRTIKTKYYRQFEVDCTLNFYRKGSLNHASRIVEFNRLMSIADELKRHKVGVNYIGAVQNLTQLFSANMEERANIRMTLWYSDAIEDEVNTIEQTHIVIENEKERVIAEFDVHV